MGHHLGRLKINGKYNSHATIYVKNASLLIFKEPAKTLPYEN